MHSSIALIAHWFFFCVCVSAVADCKNTNCESLTRSLRLYSYYITIKKMKVSKKIPLKLRLRHSDTTQTTHGEVLLWLRERQERGQRGDGCVRVGRRPASDHHNRFFAAEKEWVLIDHRLHNVLQIRPHLFETSHVAEFDR